MINNSDIDIIIYRYLGGEARDEDIRVLQEWIEASEENRARLLEMQNMWEMSNPVFDPSAIDTASAHDKVDGMIRKPRKVSLWTITQRVAAILFLPLLAASIYLYSISAEAEDVSMLEIRTPHSTWSQLDLPDGSRVWLNAGSSIKYPTRFGKGERQVSVDGEVYFEVESDTKHPFVVRAGDMTVAATGTQFNVNHYAADSIATVVLVSGRVSVSPYNTGAPVMLSPGEMLNYNRNSFSHSVAVTDTYKWSAWRDGIMAFRDDPLDFVFKRLGQTYNVDFVIRNAELRDYLYRATFEGESLDEILKLIQMSVPVKYREISDRRSGNMPVEKKRIEIYKAK